METYVCKQLWDASMTALQRSSAKYTAGSLLTAQRSFKLQIKKPEGAREIRLHPASLPK